MFFQKEKLIAYSQLMRIDRPIGTLLLLWPTLWALFLANDGFPPIHLLIVFILGVIFMRAAGCVINDYADRHIDGSVKRTVNRPLATGKATAKEAKILFAILLFLSFILVLFLNKMAILLSFVGAFLAIIYPFMKRYTNLPQVFLGCAFGWAIPMAYGASIETLPLACWLLFAANLLWTVAYDTQYAMVDRDDDLRIGVKSTAILFGRYDNLIIALLQFVALILLLAVGVVTHMHFSYFLVIVATMGLFIYQGKLTKKRERNDCFKAFLNNNYVGLMIFIAVLCGIFLA